MLCRNRRLEVIQWVQFLWNSRALLWPQRTNRRAVTPLPSHHCFLCFQIKFSETPYSGFWTDLLVPLNFICLPIQPVPWRQQFLAPLALCQTGPSFFIKSCWRGHTMQIESAVLFKLSSFHCFLVLLLLHDLLQWPVQHFVFFIQLLLYLNRWSPPWLLQSQNVPIFSVFSFLFPGSVSQEEIVLCLFQRQHFHFASGYSFLLSLFSPSVFFCWVLYSSPVKSLLLLLRHSFPSIFLKILSL